MPNFFSPTGKLITAGLFADYAKDLEYACYVLADHDRTYKTSNGDVVYPSLRRLYMEISDITEYEFGNKYFDSFRHWQVLCDEEFFKPHIARWRKELELKIKSEALKEIIKQASSQDPRKRLEASKYIFEKVFRDPDSRAGRPTKKQIKEEAVRKAREEQIISEDWDRLVGNEKTTLN